MTFQFDQVNLSCCQLQGDQLEVDKTPRQRDFTFDDLKDLCGKLNFPDSLYPIPIIAAFSNPCHILHEIAHFAVKPNSYLEMWVEAGRPGRVPNLDWISTEGYFKPQDPTPDEFGARAWSLEVLRVMGLRNPLDGKSWPSLPSDRFNPEQWQRNHTKSKCHPFYKNGLEQLQAMGIDFSQSDPKFWRPSINWRILGWQPVMGFDLVA